MRQLGTRDFDRLNKHIQDFVGAAPSDISTASLKEPYSIVMNTENHLEGGDHWVAMRVDSQTFMFLDSFGREPSDMSFPNDFRQTVKRMGQGRKLIYNTKLVQALDSNACGFHAIFFLDSLALNKPLRTILRVFGSDLAANDAFVFRYFKNNFM